MEIADANQLKIIGHLTQEEQQVLIQFKQETAQILAKIGEYEILKTRYIQKADELETRAQSLLNSVTDRLGLDPGVQWVTLPDGSIRLVEQAANSVE